jgi:hypothetical protein
MRAHNLEDTRDQHTAFGINPIIVSASILSPSVSFCLDSVMQCCGIVKYRDFTKFKVCKALSFTRFRFKVQGVSQRSVYFSLFFLENKPGYIY